MVPIDREAIERMLFDADEHERELWAALVEARLRVKNLEHAHREAQEVTGGLRRAALALNIPTSDERIGP